MRALANLLPLTALLAAPVFAQEGEGEMEMGMPPAPELAAFDVFLGSWTGSGTAQLGPGDPMEWTAVSEVTRILGGHFVQEEMRVDTPMGPMYMHTLYGIDPATKEIVMHGFSGNGNAPAQASWLDENKLYVQRVGVMEGQPMLERWTNTFSDEGYGFAMEQAFNGGPVFQTVEGRFRRSEEPNVGVLEASAERNELAPEHQKLDSWCGQYEVAGTMTMMGMDMEITADVSLDWMLGGQVLMETIHGQPGDYEARNYMYWDANQSCYVNFAATNMGEVGSGKAQWVDGKYVATSANPMMGEPGCDRTIVEQDENGHIARATTHRIPAVGDPYLMFTATYTRTGDAGEGASETVSRFTEGSCCARAESAGKACTHPCCIAAAEKGEVCSACN